MVRLVLTVLFAALGAACAGVAGFSDPPDARQLVALMGACIFVAAYQITTEINSAYLSKKSAYRASLLIVTHSRWLAARGT
ncbi:MAG: hypothetical protein ACRDRR_12360 [Pseudonocardiaceae bacterium]